VGQGDRRGLSPTSATPCHTPPQQASPHKESRPRSPHAPNPLPHLRAPTRHHREAHAHEPLLTTPDVHGAPRPWICQATASPAPAQDVARRILGEDVTQIDYYTERVKRMVGKVLTGNGITRYDQGADGLVGTVAVPLAPR